MIFSFLFFLAIFTLIGVSSYWQSRGTKQDYYVASGNIRPWLVGLSAVATNNSGYMFIGVIGYTYATGLASIWLMFGWILGDFIASIIVHKRFKQASVVTGEVSYAGVLSNWDGDENPLIQKVIAIISLIFLLAYTSAQLMAGSKALHVLFNWPDWMGAVMGGILVSVYCLAGGIRASIWTDAAQSFVMIFAMGLLFIVAVHDLGGAHGALTKMNQINGFMDWVPDLPLISGPIGGILFAVSWLFAGLSVIGQPHIMVRFMTIDHARGIVQARLWYYLWFLAFYSMATGVGMLSRIYLSNAGSFDAELALPMMAMDLLPPPLVGLIIAGIFAATMSTADSLVLSCSAALTHDLIPHNIESTSLIKLFTGLITISAVIWALLSQESVFSLVILAWSALASAFAPLLLVLCCGSKPGKTLSLVAIFSGFVAAGFWRYLGWQEYIYEGMIGILIGLGALVLGQNRYFKSLIGVLK